MTATATAAHIFPLTIDPADIDFMGHVNNATYLKWVQAAVVDHWERYAAPVDRGRLLWVAVKHEIYYRRPAFLRDQVAATVILRKLQGARAWYETVIGRGTEGLAEVSSIWCCLDAESHRPVRIHQSIIDRFGGRQRSPQGI